MVSYSLQSGKIYRQPGHHRINRCRYWCGMATGREVLKLFRHMRSEQQVSSKPSTAKSETKHNQTGLASRRGFMRSSPRVLSYTHLAVPDRSNIKRSWRPSLPAYCAPLYAIFIAGFTKITENKSLSAFAKRFHHTFMNGIPAANLQCSQLL